MKKGFTLAEVLITLGVIGVVAALTIPVLVTNIQSKVTERKQQVFKAKLLDGLNETAIQHTLMGFNSTMDFAKELQKHYKMISLCDTNNVASCYNIGEATLNDAGDTLNISEVNSVKYLSLDEEKYLPPVTMVATDGTVFIMSYNKNCAVADSDIKANGGALSCIDGVIDINGASKPNKVGQDILSFRSGILAKGKVDYPWVTVSSDDGSTYELSESFGPLSLDEAKSTCANIGGALPTIMEFESFKFNADISGDFFWTSSTECGYSSKKYCVGDISDDILLGTNDPNGLEWGSDTVFPVHATCIKK